MMRIPDVFRGQEAGERGDAMPTKGRMTKGVKGSVAIINYPSKCHVVSQVAGSVIPFRR